ncbi:MAG: RNA polymerase factor sigma-54 [Methylocystaceae bacterium]
MRLNYEINLEQQQKLLITPELRQAIAILQMSAPELEEYIDQEMEQNPFLELSEENSSKEEVNTDSGEEPAQLEEMADWVEYFSDRSDLGFSNPTGEEKSGASMAATGNTLQEYLLLQLHLAINSPEDQRIGEYLIGCIDDRGYLAVTVEEIALALAVPSETVSDVLKLVQGFDPAGVGARDIKETLTLQLKAQGKATPLLLELINKYLPEVAVNKLKSVARALGITVHEVQNLCDQLRTLNPHPGNQFSGGDEPRYIVPDILVDKIDDQYVVSLNDYRVPGLRVNQLYQGLLKNPQQFSRDEQKYMEDRLASAIWLIKSIEHRKLTLFRVASCLVEMQKDFLDHGIKYLKPLTLKQVADRVEVHESTISRATTNKYIQTPRGVFELKFFFSSSLKGQDLDETVSARATKRLIQELIEAEDRANPLSDKQIADLLQEQGVTCSRRTVAKYRAEMGIAQGSARKRY